MTPRELQKALDLLIDRYLYSNMSVEEYLSRRRTLEKKRRRK